MAQYTRAKEKNWQTSNFRLSIQGCEDACKRVSRIEGFSIKQQILEYPSGSLRDREKESLNLETSNLVITLSEAHADPFFKWHESFVVNGKNELDHEKTGRLQYLSPDLKSVLITVDFTGLGIFKLTPEKVEAGTKTSVGSKLRCIVRTSSFDTGTSYDRRDSEVGYFTVVN